MEKTSNLRDFEVVNKLGQGAFGQVFKVKRKADGKQYALKKVKIGAMKDKQRDNALNQIRILASYNQQFIIGYKQAFYDQTSATLCVVMQFAQGGDIYKNNQNHLKKRTKYKEQQIWKALVHMCKGLKSLHDRKILHRDLKAANIFITGQGVYKLGDLNVSKVLKKDMAQTQTGTPYYASPQVWKDRPYNAKSDMWSLGCVLYEMAALKPPFTATDLQGLYKKVCTGIFERIPANYSNDLANVVGSLLKVDPQRRPSTQQLLSSPVVRKYYTGELLGPVQAQDDFDQLLKTIKYNPRDLKGLKNILPKANYEQQQKIWQQIKVPQSAKSARKQPSIKQQIKASLNYNDKKLTEFLQKKKKYEQKQRERHLQVLKQQKELLAKKRERVLSACGIRPADNLNQPTPKIVKHQQQQQYYYKKPEYKQQPKGMAAKLPPKPQGNISYKLPPRPSQPQVQYSQYKQEPRPQSRQEKKGLSKQIQTPYSATPRVNRSNSVQKVIYPSWWG